MAKVRVTQIKSAIDRPRVQKATLAALGIKRVHGSAELEVNPQIQGMINKVKHLVKIENI
jgi:large subunit ribosomal protein L30